MSKDKNAASISYSEFIKIMAKPRDPYFPITIPTGFLEERADEEMRKRQKNSETLREIGQGLGSTM